MREKDIWTVSRLKTFQVCPYKEMLRYREEITPIQARSALAFGTAMHKGLETRDLYEALNTLVTDYPKDQEEADAQDTATVALTALLTNYFEIYPPFEEHKPELEFMLPMRTEHRSSRKYAIAGKMDDLAYLDGRWWIVEYKTASKLDASYFDRLYVDSQISMYMTAATRMGYNPAGVLYRVIRKPTIRKGQKETLDAFLMRLKEDIKSRPEFYFMERQLYRDTEDLEEFERTLYKEAKLENQMWKNGDRFKHSTACSMYGACEYLPICTGEAGALEALYERRAPHEELTKGAFE